MGPFDIGSTPSTSEQTNGDVIQTLILTADTVSSQSVAKLLTHPAGTALVVGFISPHLDFHDLAARIRTCIPQSTQLLLVSSAGELCDQQAISPYCPTGEAWDRIVLASFSRALFAEVAVSCVPLPDEDIRQGQTEVTNDERIARLSATLKCTTPPFTCDYRDTFVLTFIDGLSHCETHLLEAIYKSNLFPLFFIGGSAGGKFDFKHTYLYDGHRVLEDHAILCFIKLAPGMRYGVFKSQNFQRTPISFVIADADPDLRILRSVVVPSSFETRPFLDALTDALQCAPQDLAARLAGMTFGIEVGGELYVRSIKEFHEEDGSASFYCDVDFGDCLYLLEPTDFAATTQADFKRFIAGKPKPIGALFNDCILRRLNNTRQLAEIDAFNGIPLAGFSTFGEIFGLFMNQTLSAIFFFAADDTFTDDLIDRFPIHYASYCGHFDRRAAIRLRTLEGLRKEQERMQRQLRREHEFSQALISSLPGVFGLTDALGKLVLWNENMELVTGRSAESLSKMPVTDLFCTEDQAIVKEVTARALTTGKASGEARVILRAGLAPYYITVHSIVLDGERYTTGIGIDITDRKHIEAALQSSRKRLKMITDSLSEGVLVVDKTGCIAFANPSAIRLLECASMGDVEGHPIGSVFRLSTGDDAIPPWDHAIVTGETLRNDDAAVLTVEGRKLPIAYACTPLADGDSAFTAILSFRDIRALKEAERDLIQSSRLASVGQLASGIAHEINTPIQYIGNNLNFINSSLAQLSDAFKTLQSGAADSDNDKLDFLLEEMPIAIAESLDGVSQISRIVLSMKEFSHPGTVNKTMSDINRAIESTLAVSRNVWKHVANVVEDLDPSLPPVLCHAGELNQVFLNLIVNAAHAIESSGKTLPGTITISTRHTDDSVEIRITDTGTGVPEALRERIFDPFFTTKDVGKGTGQGLAICRDVVMTKHGGRLDVEGEEGQGAIFIVRLPTNNNDDTKEQSGW